MDEISYASYTFLGGDGFEDLIPRPPFYSWLESRDCISRVKRYLERGDREKIMIMVRRAESITEGLGERRDRRIWFRFKRERERERGRIGFWGGIKAQR